MTPLIPLTVTVDGYGAAAPASGSVIEVVFENVDVAAEAASIPAMNNATIVTAHSETRRE
jgi:hypothetical protein